ncbi:MAG: hypothetical protein R3C61_00645 [Bacteroidia bacterium]
MKTLILTFSLSTAFYLSACTATPIAEYEVADTPASVSLTSNESDMQTDRVVIINGQRVPENVLQALELQYGVKILEGRYWYDRLNGLWGMEGGPGAGIIMPGMNLGGPLQRNASGGNTGVFINGRELHSVDVSRLQALGTVYQGRYWLDAYGYFGYEGGPALGNLVQLAQQSGGYSRNGGSNIYNQNGNTFYRNGYTGIGGGSDGKTSYVIGSDFSVIVD